jgi:hypothetical protein
LKPYARSVLARMLRADRRQDQEGDPRPYRWRGLCFSELGVSSGRIMIANVIAALA